MSTITPTTDKQGQGSAWQLLLSSNISKLGSPRKQGNKGASIGESLEYDEAKAEQLVDCFVAALSPKSERELAKVRDIEVMKRACSALLEVMEESILTESEASALTEFLASKFIERRFDVILQDLFDVKTSRKNSFRVIRGNTK